MCFVLCYSEIVINLGGVRKKKVYVLNDSMLFVFVMWFGLFFFVKICYMKCEKMEIFNIRDYIF